MWVSVTIPLICHLENKDLKLFYLNPSIEIEDFIYLIKSNSLLSFMISNNVRFL